MLRTRHKKSIESTSSRGTDVFSFLEQDLLGIPKYARRLGKISLEAVRNDFDQNNDPLAHVWVLAEQGVTQTALERIKVEFETDMSERSPELGHYHVFDMQVVNDDLVTSSGLWMRDSMQRSLEATRRDAAIDPRRSYGVLREQAQVDQIDKILKWYGSGEGTYFGFASLCPDAGELDPDSARVNGFKPDRQMASVWLYERINSGVRMHAFSFDHCHTDNLQEFYDTMGIRHQVESNSLSELSNPLSTDEHSPQELRASWLAFMDHGRDKHTQAKSANEVVQVNSEAFEFYMNFVVDITASLAYKRVSPKLARSLAHLRKAIGYDYSPALNRRMFQKFTSDDARGVMQFVRSRVVPHYLFGQESQSGSHSDSVFSASAGAASRPTAYDGACPSSSSENQVVQLAEFADSGLMHRSLVVDKLMADKRKGNCLTCGVESTVYGCGLCGECNRVWCDEYKNTGKGLSLKEVSKKTRSKNTKKPNTTRQTLTSRK